MKNNIQVSINLSRQITKNQTFSKKEKKKKFTTIFDTSRRLSVVCDLKDIKTLNFFLLCIKNKVQFKKIFF